MHYVFTIQFIEQKNNSCMMLILHLNKLEETWAKKFVVTNSCHFNPSGSCKLKHCLKNLLTTNLSYDHG